jgi:hypothetical protein
MQEVFIPYAVETLKAKLPLAGLKHVMHFINGADMPGQAAGSGCIIASRYPILDTAWHPFTVGGKPYRIDQWDWHAAKGIGMARILLPAGYGTADVYVSHLQAQYHDSPHDTYLDQRVIQSLEASMFIRSTRRSDLTLFLADLNSGPDSLVYRTLATLAGFKDAYSCTHTKEETLHHGGTLTEIRTGAHPLPSPVQVVRSIYDSTFGNDRNVFSSTFPAANGASALCPSRPLRCDVDARLDYILFGTGSVSWPFTVAPFSVSLLHRTWHVLHSDIRLTEHIPLLNGRNVNLSDHSAVYAELACVIVAPDISGAGSHQLQEARANTEVLGFPLSPAAESISAKDTVHPNASVAVEGTGGAGSPCSNSSSSDGPAGDSGAAVRQPNILAEEERSIPKSASFAGGLARAEPVSRLRRISSTGTLSHHFSTQHQLDAENMLKAAIAAAGVPLDRCAALPSEMQEERRNSGDRVDPEADYLLSASSPVKLDQRTPAWSWLLQSCLPNRTRLLPNMVVSVASGALHPAHDSSSASVQSWRPVLLECMAVLQQGEKGLANLAFRQISTAIFLLLLSIGISTHLWIHYEPINSAACTIHAAIFALGFCLAYLGMVKFSGIRSTILNIAVLIGVGITSTVWLISIHGGVAMLASLAGGLCPLALLLFFVATFMSTLERRGYARAIQQVNILLERPPAVVA